MKTGNSFPRPNYDFDYFKPSRIKDLLNENAASPQKKWGQNFLIDPNIVQFIISSFSEENDSIECIGEIGPGLGALSHRITLSKYPAFFFEIDPFFCKFLESQDYFQKSKHILFKGNVLENLDKVSEKKIFLFGNLPYYITSDILTTILGTIADFQGGVFMVQKEFALRLTREVASISVFVSAFCEVKILKKVSKNCFFPAPKEESAIISLRPLKKLFSSKIQVNQFELVLKTFFWGKRKTLYKSAREAPFFVSDIQRHALCEVLNELGIPEGKRPEELDKTDFYKIALGFIKKGV